MENVTNEFKESIITEAEAEERSRSALCDMGLSEKEQEKFLSYLSNGRGSDEEEAEYYSKAMTRSTPTNINTVYTNSPLVKYVCWSPNCNTPRNHAIDTITIHEVWGECTMQLLGDIFRPVSRQASSTYGCCENGVGQYVPEGSRPWTSGSAENDNRAVTIETSNSRTYPNAVNSNTYNLLIQLCADICKRNGKTKMVWCGSLAATNARKFASNEMRMTLHKWFQATDCPGYWLESHMQDIANKVNALLLPKYPEVPFSIKVLIDDLNLRKGAGTNYAVKGYAAKGNHIIDKVKNNYGYIKKLKGWVYLPESKYVRIGGHIEVSPFKDVKTTDSAYKYIKEVYEAGLMKGINGKFYPKRKVTRQQLAIVMAKMLEKQKK